ncbi:MAG: GNAT family N-acetyltransferase [Gordonibacter pamelaeae]
MGYTGGHVEPATNRFSISKIYLRAEERGRGFASQTIRFYEDLCRTRGLAAMYLTVNKHNDLGVRAYQGFRDHRLGGDRLGRLDGFVMIGCRSTIGETACCDAPSI